ncbi:MAG: bestrophin family ion channel [Vulcanimicrobiota bacterium]
MDGESWWARTRRFLSYPVFRRIIGSVLISCVYGWLSMHYEILILGEDVEFPASVHTLLGVSLSVLIVFRNNSSYDRWWEGRKLWGSLVNRSRSLAALVWSARHLPEADRRQFLLTIPEFACKLRDHLRGPWPAPDNLPQRLLNGLNLQLGRWENQSSTQFFLAVEGNLHELYDILGACERIRGTPLPLSHRAIVPQAILIYLLALPWGLPHGPISILIIGLVSYFLISLEMIAEEIEEPFGHDPDDLPLSRLCVTIEKSVQRQLEITPEGGISRAGDAQTALQ